MNASSPQLVIMTGATKVVASSNT